MNIKRIVVGPLQTNCYILEKDENCIIIDPGAWEDKIIANIEKKVVGVITTHSHDDHIGALKEITNKYQVKEYNFANLPEGNFSIENFSFEVIYTPGHKKDEIVIYFRNEKIMFVGDFIFKGSIGRMDLEGGNPLDMKKSIKKILEYPLDIVLYPGHFATTTLRDEFDTLNYYFNII